MVSGVVSLVSGVSGVSGVSLVSASEWCGESSEWCGESSSGGYYLGDGYVNIPPPSIMGNDKDSNDKATSNFDDVSVCTCVP